MLSFSPDYIKQQLTQLIALNNDFQQRQFALKSDFGLTKLHSAPGFDDLIQVHAAVAGGGSGGLDQVTAFLAGYLDWAEGALAETVRALVEQDEVLGSYLDAVLRRGIGPGEWDAETSAQIGRAGVEQARLNIEPKPELRVGSFSFPMPHAPMDSYLAWEGYLGGMDVGALGQAAQAWSQTGQLSASVATELTRIADGLADNTEGDAFAYAAEFLHGLAGQALELSESSAVMAGSVARLGQVHASASLELSAIGAQLAVIEDPVIREETEQVLMGGFASSLSGELGMSVPGISRLISGFDGAGAGAGGGAFESTLSAPERSDVSSGLKAVDASAFDGANTGAPAVAGGGQSLAGVKPAPVPEGMMIDPRLTGMGPDGRGVFFDPKKTDPMTAMRLTSVRPVNRSIFDTQADAFTGKNYFDDLKDLHVKYGMRPPTPKEMKGPSPWVMPIEELRQRKGWDNRPKGHPWHIPGVTGKIPDAFKRERQALEARYQEMFRIQREHGEMPGPMDKSKLPREAYRGVLGHGGGAGGYSGGGQYGAGGHGGQYVGGRLDHGVAGGSQQLPGQAAAGAHSAGGSGVGHPGMMPMRGMAGAGAGGASQGAGGGKRWQVWRLELLKLFGLRKPAPPAVLTPDSWQEYMDERKQYLQDRYYFRNLEGDKFPEQEEDLIPEQHIRMRSSDGEEEEPFVFESPSVRVLTPEEALRPMDIPERGEAVKPQPVDSEAPQSATAEEPSAQAEPPAPQPAEPAEPVDPPAPPKKSRGLMTGYDPRTI